ncbi:uncharacterized protein LOC116210678 [Punica granatum]|uniref:Uncharacterized protein LOC116210678 n=1 Tax=Punica granatum TaxID=22663 RepID=A0A6P8DXZ9_PUNGR|nr:uncharacterized protein LOC116210678 [Punica granatum]
MLAKAIVERTRLAKSSAAKMKDFPSCFGESGVQVADSSSSSSPSSISPKHAQNFVTSVYKCKLSSHSCLITVTWTKGLMGQGLSVAIDDSTHQSLCKVDIKPWLFSKRKGHRSTEVVVHSGPRTVDVYWDLCNARFGPGPEPAEGFYLAIAFDRELVLLLGDMKKEACRKIDAEPAAPSFSAVLVGKRENIFGKKSYGTRAQFRDKGRAHDVAIECDTGGLSDPSLVVRVDDKVVMQVRRLRWKFRGNGTIHVDGMPVEVYWDVHNWLFGNSAGNAVFMFHSSLLGEKSWTEQSIFDRSMMDCSNSYRELKESKVPGVDFSVIFYAWRSE